MSSKYDVIKTAAEVAAYGLSIDINEMIPLRRSHNWHASFFRRLQH